MLKRLSISSKIKPVPKPPSPQAEITPHSASHTTILSLPTELHHQILSYLPISDHISASFALPLWGAIIAHPLLIQPRYFEAPGGSWGFVPRGMHRIFHYDKDPSYLTVIYSLSLKKIRGYFISRKQLGGPLEYAALGKLCYILDEPMFNPKCLHEPALEKYLQEFMVTLDYRSFGPGGIGSYIIGHLGPEKERGFGFGLRKITVRQFAESVVKKLDKSFYHETRDGIGGKDLRLTFTTSTGGLKVITYLNNHTGQRESKGT